MPWSNQGGGGGPWGSGGGGGGGGPWGGGGGGRPTGGGPTPPDLEEVLRKSQDRLKQALPSGFGGGRGIVIALVAVVLVWLASGLYRVNPDEEGVVLRFGEYVRSTGPGLHYHLPSPIESVIKPPVTRINRIDIGFVGGGEGRGSVRLIPEEALMLTGDENIIDINFTVLWRIANARDYLFNVQRPEAVVKIAAESAMREVVGRTDIQPALNEARGDIERGTRDILQQILDEYGAGITVVEVQLQKVDPPEEVVDAFNDVLRARQDQQRLRNQAEAYRNDIIPRARGEAERMIQEASAYREEVVNRAIGDAQRFQSILASYQLAPAVTAQRLYLETIEDVFRGVNKVIIDDNSAGGQGVVPYLPLNELQRRQTSALGGN